MNGYVEIVPTVEWKPFLIAAVKKRHAEFARRVARERAAKDLKEDRRPEFYLVWDPEVLSKEDYARLVVSLGGTVRRAGGVGVVRVSGENYVADGA